MAELPNVYEKARKVRPLELVGSEVRANQRRRLTPDEANAEAEATEYAAALEDYEPPSKEAAEYAEARAAFMRGLVNENPDISAADVKAKWKAAKQAEQAKVTADFARRVLLREETIQLAGATRKASAKQAAAPPPPPSAAQAAAAEARSKEAEENMKAADFLDPNAEEEGPEDDQLELEEEEAEEEEEEEKPQKEPPPPRAGPAMSMLAALAQEKNEAIAPRQEGPKGKGPAVQQTTRETPQSQPARPLGPAMTALMRAMAEPTSPQVLPAVAAMFTPVEEHRFTLVGAAAPKEEKVDVKPAVQPPARPPIESVVQAMTGQASRGSATFRRQKNPEAIAAWWQQRHQVPRQPVALSFVAAYQPKGIRARQGSGPTRVFGLSPPSRPHLPQNKKYPYP